MLTIRRSQMDAMKAAARSQLVDRIAQTIRSGLPDRFASGDRVELHASVETSIRQASRLGVTTERGFAAWACLAVICGERFWAAPAVAGLLRDSSMSPDDRVGTLFASLVRQAKRTAGVE